MTRRFRLLAVASTFALLVCILAAAPAAQASRRMGWSRGVRVVLLIDRSGSMSGANLASVHAAVKLAVERLRDYDAISVISFDASAHVEHAIGRVGARTSRRAVIAATDAIRAGGGTSVLPALVAANAQLRRAGATTQPWARKRTLVLLVSDGHSAYDGVLSATKALATRAVISTIGLGQQADSALLRKVATAGRGRAYTTVAPNKLSTIVRKELARLGR
ncbi:MAG: VWA domain-containing protein [Myxococcales bacterium]|nr:VWA domain-containing protein [Myxococcales bacterium]